MDSSINFLLANLFILSSFFAEEFTQKMFLIILGILWLIAYAIIYDAERTLNRLERRNKNIRDNLIIKLLMKIAKIKLPEKKQNDKI